MKASVSVAAPLVGETGFLSSSNWCRMRSSVSRNFRLSMGGRHGKGIVDNKHLGQVFTYAPHLPSTDYVQYVLWIRCELLWFTPRALFHLSPLVLQELFQILLALAPVLVVNTDQEMNNEGFMYEWEWQNTERKKKGTLLTNDFENKQFFRNQIHMVCYNYGLLCLSKTSCF